HLADLVKQYGAALRQFETSRTALQGSSESALLVAEDFTFDQCFRDGGTIDRYEGPLPARTQFMDGASHQFFSCSAGTGDQNRCGARSHEFDQSEDFLHLARGSAQLA